MNSVALATLDGTQKYWHTKLSMSVFAIGSFVKLPTHSSTGTYQSLSSSSSLNVNTALNSSSNLPRFCSGTASYIDFLEYFFTVLPTWMNDRLLTLFQGMPSGMPTRLQISCSGPTLPRQ